MIQENPSDLIEALAETNKALLKALDLQRDANQVLHREMFIRDLTIFAMQYPLLFDRLRQNETMRSFFPELELFDS